MCFKKCIFPLLRPFLDSTLISWELLPQVIFRSLWSGLFTAAAVLFG